MVLSEAEVLTIKVALLEAAHWCEGVAADFYAVGPEGGKRHEKLIRKYVENAREMKNLYRKIMGVSEMECK